MALGRDDGVSQVEVSLPVRRPCTSFPRSLTSGAAGSVGHGDPDHRLPLWWLRDVHEFQPSGEKPLVTSYQGKSLDAVRRLVLECSPLLQGHDVIVVSILRIFVDIRF